MTDSIQFVYFDLDDTLLDHRRAERNALADLAHSVWGSEATGHLKNLHTSYTERNRQLWHAYADGDIGRDELRELRFSHIVEQFDLKGTAWRDLDRFYMDRYSTHWTVIEGAREAFESIASGRSVGVITNGFATVQREKLARFPFISDRSHAVIISEECGYLKPDPRLFEKATDEAGVPGNQILYIGDSYRSDVLGALAAGWRAAWFTPSTTESLPERAFAFSDWGRLLERLGLSRDSGHR